jgi:hypothetical protein
MLCSDRSCMRLIPRAYPCFKLRVRGFGTLLMPTDGADGWSPMSLAPSAVIL